MKFLHVLKKITLILGITNFVFSQFILITEFPVNHFFAYSYWVFFIIFFYIRDYLNCLSMKDDLMKKRSVSDLRVVFEEKRNNIGVICYFNQNKELFLSVYKIKPLFPYTKYIHKKTKSLSSLIEESNKQNYFKYKNAVVQINDADNTFRKIKPDIIEVVTVDGVEKSVEISLDESDNRRIKENLKRKKLINTAINFILLAVLVLSVYFLSNINDALFFNNGYYLTPQETVNQYLIDKETDEYKAENIVFQYENDKQIFLLYNSSESDLLSCVIKKVPMIGGKRYRLQRFNNNSFSSNFRGEEYKLWEQQGDFYYLFVNDEESIVDFYGIKPQVDPIEYTLPSSDEIFSGYLCFVDSSKFSQKERVRIWRSDFYENYK